MHPHIIFLKIGIAKIKSSFNEAISQHRNVINESQRITQKQYDPKVYWIIQKKLQFPSQDVLNVACYGKILTLLPKYNVPIPRLKDNSPLLRELFSEKDIFEAKNEPYIIHYAGKKKPWNSLGIYLEKFWWDIAKQTPYANIFFNRKKKMRKKVSQKVKKKVKMKVKNLKNIKVN